MEFGSRIRDRAILALSPLAKPTKRLGHDPRGEVPEWSNGAVSKTVVGASPPRVRIPVSPPLSILTYFNNTIN